MNADLVFLPIANQLPAAARDALVAAARTPVGPGDHPLTRQRAVEKAIAFCKRNYPHLFHKD